MGVWGTEPWCVVRGGKKGQREGQGSRHAACITKLLAISHLALPACPSSGICSNGPSGARLLPHIYTCAHILLQPGRKWVGHAVITFGVT